MKAVGDIKLVVDANILIAALVSRGVTCNVLFTRGIEFIAPSFIFEEINKHWGEIVEKSGISESELKLEFNSIKPQIKPFSIGEYGKFLERAMHISVDPDDIDFFALALKFSCPIWSYDPHFKLQSEVRILGTKDVLDLIRVSGAESR